MLEYFSRWNYNCKVFCFLYECWRLAGRGRLARSSGRRRASSSGRRETARHRLLRACACARIRSGLPGAPSSASGTLDFGQRFASLGREPSALWLQDSGQGHRVSCAWRRQSSAGASALPIFRARVRPRSECAPSADPLRPEAAHGRSCVLQ